MYELVDLWAADLKVSFPIFLKELFGNIAEWSDDEGGHWKFKEMGDVKCEGDAFEQMKVLLIMMDFVIQYKNAANNDGFCNSK